MDDGMVRAQAECTKVSCHSSVKDSCLFQHVTEIYVGIQEARIQLYSLDIAQQHERIITTSQH